MKSVWGRFGVWSMGLMIVAVIGLAGCDGKKAAPAPGDVRFSCIDVSTSGTTKCGSPVASMAIASTIYTNYDSGQISKSLSDIFLVQGTITNTMPTPRRGFWFAGLNTIPGCGSAGYISADVLLAANNGTYTMEAGYGCADAVEGPAYLTAYFYDTTDDPSMPDNWVACCARVSDMLEYAAAHEAAAVATASFVIVP